jgi:glycosyltransferase involved in cell wall biosynthesis
MKVLFDHSNPFFLAHGGFQTQIEQTKLALEAVGIEVEFVRWWDDSQWGDAVHFFGRPALSYVDFTHQKGMAFVLGELLTGLGSRSAPLRFAQKAIMSSAQTLLPDDFTARLGWETYARADACIALTPWERRLMVEMFSAPSDRTYSVPNGVEEVFLRSARVQRGQWLVCTATITERKRPLELAEAAIEARTPLWLIGRSYAAADPYADRFLRLAKANPSLIRYEGGISDRAQLAEIYRQARGFVLLSTMESLSLSALEAAACECPLLLSDLPWARYSFGATVSYCPVPSPGHRTAAVLRRFYDEAPKLPVPPKPKSWVEVAGLIRSVYEAALLRNQANPS